MPLLSMTGGMAPDTTDRSGEATQPVLVFADGHRSMGLMVEAIVDIVHDRLHVELGAGGPGVLGTAVVAGQAAEILDTGYWLTLAWRDWFGDMVDSSGRPRVLVVDDSDFFRQLLGPTLAAAGYEVIAAGSAAEALRMRDAGLAIDIILSDLEMPEIDGLAFVQAVRRDGAWSDLPMIALSARGGPSDAARSRAAGFTDHVHKSQRAALMERIRQCLAESPLAAGGAACHG